ncbi:GPI inositol deacylase [Schizosaccharomyces japonicus yFS275]|uniref:GPI inositol-deacylase n=1 Tax=Schizosaccharomyces japonicus (strain yFS275 / FY16936) TaxID=402676 RepID=B6JYA9_SCHJY|nr:GPI inositol deacylase [Schizosaccharomyces japonicus yFS275]EEB06527.2 GPI inositol deacylase [Schizosaccharomyces japonicus yFS275]
MDTVNEKVDHGTFSPSNESIASSPERSYVQQKRTKLSAFFKGYSFPISIFSIVFLFLVFRSFVDHQPVNSCETSTVWPSYARIHDFDERYTRFSEKYSLYLYREKSVIENAEPSGIPIIFIPGNAGSYKQVRAFAADVAHQFADLLSASYDEAIASGKRNLDFFTLDFNEDFSAFHGQTLIDQAEYVNDAIAYILSLYPDTRTRSSFPDDDLPYPTSVILLGHSMGGMVAQSVFSLYNYVKGSVNTIITLSAPHTMAPFPIDRHLVEFYDSVKEYWTNSFLQPPENNALADVFVLSIGGGGLDTTVVPEYSAISSFVPPTNGLVIFTSGIPFVWAEVDHEAMAWCERFRQVVSRGLLAVTDARFPGGTKPLDERRALFWRTYVYGASIGNDLFLNKKDPLKEMLLYSEDTEYLGEVAHVTFDHFGDSNKKKTVVPLPHGKFQSFQLLTDQSLDIGSHVRVQFCKLDPSSSFPGSDDTEFGINALCHEKNEFLRLYPASTFETKHPHDGGVFYYLSAESKDLVDYDFILIDDRNFERREGFLEGFLSPLSLKPTLIDSSVLKLLTVGERLEFSPNNTLLSAFHFTGLQSSLFSYKLTLEYEIDDGVPALFAPFMKQKLQNPVESRYFPNIKSADIIMHGVSPFIDNVDTIFNKSLVLEFYMNPLKYQHVFLRIQPDYYGSMGRLLMRYRTLLASFPFVILAYVLRNQITRFNKGGSFSDVLEALELFARRGLIKLLAVVSLLTVFLSMSYRATTASAEHADNAVAAWRASAINSRSAFWKQNYLVFGLQEPMVWMLAPVLTIVFIGFSVSLNFLLTVILKCVSFLIRIFVKLRRSFKNIFFSPAKENIQQLTQETDLGDNVFKCNKRTIQFRIIANIILLTVSLTVVPFQFAYLFTCLTQICTTAKALYAAECCEYGPSVRRRWSFFNFSLSLLVIMLHLVPFDMPIILVWIRNVSMHWYIPFPTHHNFFSIIPFILVTEIQRTGRMLPRMSDLELCLNNFLLYFLSFYSLIYGAEKPYLIHNVVGLYFMWITYLYAKDFRRRDKLTKSYNPSFSCFINTPRSAHNVNSC